MQNKRLAFSVFISSFEIPFISKFHQYAIVETTFGPRA